MTGIRHSARLQRRKKPRLGVALDSVHKSRSISLRSGKALIDPTCVPVISNLLLDEEVIAESDDSAEDDVPSVSPVELFVVDSDIEHDCDNDRMEETEEHELTNVDHITHNNSPESNPALKYASKWTHEPARPTAHDIPVRESATPVRESATPVRESATPVRESATPVHEDTARVLGSAGCDCVCAEKAGEGAVISRDGEADRLRVQLRVMRKEFHELSQLYRETVDMAINSCDLAVENAVIAERTHQAAERARQSADRARVEVVNGKAHLVKELERVVRTVAREENQKLLRSIAELMTKSRNT